MPACLAACLPPALSCLFLLACPFRLPSFPPVCPPPVRAPFSLSLPFLSSAPSPLLPSFPCPSSSLPFLPSPPSLFSFSPCFSPSSSLSPLPPCGAGVLGRVGDGWFRVGVLSGSSLGPALPLYPLYFRTNTLAAFSFCLFGSFLLVFWLAHDSSNRLN